MDPVLFAPGRWMVAIRRMKVRINMFHDFHEELCIYLVICSNFMVYLALHFSKTQRSMRKSLEPPAEAAICLCRISASFCPSGLPKKKAILELSNVLDNIRFNWKGHLILL